MNMQLDADEMAMLGCAIAKAHEAFNAEIQKDDTDPAFYRVKITIERLGSDLEQVLTTITYKDHG